MICCSACRFSFVGLIASRPRQFSQPGRGVERPANVPAVRRCVARGRSKGNHGFGSHERVPVCRTPGGCDETDVALPRALVAAQRA
jgi:hypothetical protein